jgi:anaerobic carbon-monoxide dehydrogenase iron sulfur subunit
MNKRVGVIACDEERCTGCSRCELWCSMNRYGELNPFAAAIHVVRAEPAQDKAIACQQCGVCITVCEPKALERDEETGAIVVDKEECTGCGECVAACPYGMIMLQANVAVKCELCGGDPVCVKHCPQGALSVAEIDDMVAKRRLEALQFGKGA